jgi:hypothetical protein
LAIVLLAAPVVVAGAEKPGDSDGIDPATLPKDLVVVSDGHGHFVAASLTDSEAIFYGVGATFWAQRVYGHGANPAEGDYDWRMWAPQSAHDADVALEDGKRWTVTCSQRVTPFHPLDEKDTRELLARVKFRKAPWKRQAVLLGRDDRGRYYYVDRLRDEHGGKGLRLFIGKKGRLVAQRLVDTVDDSVGLLLETRGGELHADLEKNTVWWTAGRSRKDLSFVPLADNRTLVYRELGVYRERLGVPCDDL